VRLGAAINAEAGLCETCTRHLARALDELPGDYVNVSALLTPGSRGAREFVTGSAERPIPIRVDIDAMLRDIAHESACWAESTAEVLGVVVDTQHARDARVGFSVQKHTRLLSGALSVLLSLRDVEHGAWAYGDWMVLARDGLDAANVFLDLHQRARSVTGAVALVNALPEPCPRCESRGLERPDGSETIACSVCGQYWTWDDYQRLCTIVCDHNGYAGFAA
jgi:hypothetical protein